MYFPSSSNSPLISLPTKKAPFVLTTVQSSHHNPLNSPPSPPPSPSFPPSVTSPHSFTSTPFPTPPPPSHTPHALPPTPSPPTPHSLQLRTIHHFFISSDYDSNAHKYNVFGSSPPPPFLIKPNLHNSNSPPPLLSFLTSTPSSASPSSNSLSSIPHVPSLSHLSLLTFFDCSIFFLSILSPKTNINSNCSTSSFFTFTTSSFIISFFFTFFIFSFFIFFFFQILLLFLFSRHIDFSFIQLPPAQTSQLQPPPPIPIRSSLLHKSTDHCTDAHYFHTISHPFPPWPSSPSLTPSTSPSSSTLHSSTPLEYVSPLFTTNTASLSLTPTTSSSLTASTDSHSFSLSISEETHLVISLITTIKHISGTSRHTHCAICYKEFARPSLLASHLRIHSRETPFGSHHCPNLNKHNPAPPSPPHTTHYQSSRLASTASTTISATTTTNNTPTPNNTSSEQQAQASALMSTMLSANTTTSHSYLHFPSTHHQTSHPPPLSTTPTPPMTPQTTQPRRQHHQCASHSSGSTTALPNAAPTPLPHPAPNPPQITLLYPPASTPSISPPQANQLRFQCMGCHRDFTTECAWRSHLQFPHPPSQIASPSAILTSHGVAFMAPPLSTSTPKKSSSCLLHTKTHSAHPSSVTHTAPTLLLLIPHHHLRSNLYLHLHPLFMLLMVVLMLMPLVLLQQCHAHVSSLPHRNSHTQYPQSTPSLPPTPQPPPSNPPTNQYTTTFHDTSAIDYTPCSRHDIHYTPLLPYQLQIPYVRVLQPIYKYSFLCLYIVLFTLANISIANQPLSINKYLCSNHLTSNLLTSPISNSFLLPRIAFL
nr:hypothetical transcript [Hymenolepis microstoma]CUU98080.1 hypothetical transcript [Hymenolepis microstoma]